jgi:hypothetical protein
MSDNIGARIAVFDRLDRSVNFGTLTPEQKAEFAAARQVVKSVVDAADGKPLGHVPAEVHVSNLCPSGRTTNHYWACLYPAAVPHKSYGMQVAVIVSLRGVELCCCLGAGATETKDPTERAVHEAALTQLKEGIGSLPAATRQRLATELGPEWLFRTQWRLEPGVADFANLDEWLAYAARSDSVGASISRYFIRDAIPTIELLTGYFAEAVDLFGPFFDAVYPIGPSAPASEPTDADAAAWLQVMRAYRENGTVFTSPVQGARYYVATAGDGSCEVSRLDANESEVCTASMFKQKLGLIRSRGRVRFPDLESTVVRRSTFLQASTLCLTADKQHVTELTSFGNLVENFVAMVGALNVDRSSGTPKLYKPAMLYSAIREVAEPSEPVNRIDFDGATDGFMALTERVGFDAGEQHAAIGFYHLSRKPFWLLCYKSPLDLVDPDAVSPGSIRHPRAGGGTRQRPPAHAERDDQ